MDDEYWRGWNWRSRYSAYLGIGTGIGEGNQGVACGKGEDCLAPRIIEKEVDATPEMLQNAQRDMERVQADGTGRCWGVGSWNVQEYVGAGGTLERKIKKREILGSVVKEYEDERDGRRPYLDREIKGERRSWCSWCQRVIPSVKDKVLNDACVRPPSSSGSERSESFTIAYR
jgi:hypothetical protein